MPTAQLLHMVCSAPRGMRATSRCAPHRAPLFPCGGPAARAAWKSGRPRGAGRVEVWSSDMQVHGQLRPTGVHMSHAESQSSRNRCCPSHSCCIACKLFCIRSRLHAEVDNAMIPRACRAAPPPGD